MQESTRKKIKEVQALLDQGTDIKIIIKEKFKSSPKAYNEWIEKWGENLSFRNQSEIIHPAATIPVVGENLPVFQNEEIRKLKSLIENYEGLIELVNISNGEIEEVHILDVPDELLKLYDVKVSSLRLSKAIEDRFNKFVEKNKKFSKTSLVNMALVEFLDKYE